jgi:hypothetical protein
MAFKLTKCAEQCCRRFTGHELVADVLAGVTFTDGIRVPDEHPNQDEMVARPTVFTALWPLDAS